MNRNTTRKIARIIAFTLVAALVVTSFTFMFSFAGESNHVYGAATLREADLSRELDSVEELMKELYQDYKDEVSYEELLEGAYKGVIDALEDPYSVYYSSREESDDFVESVSGEFSGVGLSLESYNGTCRVVAPISGTPAHRAGILSGDIIVKVDGKDVSELSLDAVAFMLRGETGTKVSVTVLRNGASLSFPMVRELIHAASVLFEMLPDRIGYIKITQFDKDSHLEFKNAKLQLIAKGAEAFIVDVRNNPGGYVDTAASIAEQLMPKGAIAYFERRGTIVDTINASGEGDLKKPLILLVNKGSASASEILAAAWQDSGAAKLVGTTTFGKGVAQQMFELKNGASIKLSTLYFLTPNKKPIDHAGVTPDYVVQGYEGADLAALRKEYEGFAPMAEKVKPGPGATGLNVFGAQQRLALLGYSVTASGAMDEKTVSAVKAFQKAEDFYAYGVLDYSTMNALDQAAVAYITGAGSGKDLQLEKAVELLK